jgi:hypothetical protein
MLCKSKFTTERLDALVKSAQSDYKIQAFDLKI